MEALLSRYASVTEQEVSLWFKVAPVSAFPHDSGVCVQYKNRQIAVFNFSRKGKWYACQNLCPHRLEMVLSRGLIGDDQGIAKVACPLHKQTFSLETGENLNGDLAPIAVYPVKIENGFVYVGFVD